MSIVSAIKDLCNGKNTNFAALERELGFGQGTIRKWDNSSPSVEKLQKVAEHFNTSVDFILGKENKKTPSNKELEGVEFALFGEVKDLNEKQKQDVLDFVHFIKSKEK